ncbi:MAG: stage II sporulation protein M [Lachnospiraceae bacterium]|nr:stage II sporulation protein M [Lachnospiraceae bacterium]
MWKWLTAGVRRGSVCLCFFFAGLALGTAAGISMCGMAETGAAKTSLLRYCTWRRQAGSREKFGYLFQKRAGEGMFGWLLGMSTVSVPGFFLLSGYAGFCVGWLISCCTAEFGILGLWRFLLSGFPQGIFYLAAWYLLIRRGLYGMGKARLLPAILLALLLSAGAAAETYLNPMFF